MEEWGRVRHERQANRILDGVAEFDRKLGEV